MEFHDLEVFVSVAAEKSFSRAARVVFRTQPAVSLAVRRLESELGWPLLDRSKSEVRLTDSGELLLSYAQRLLNLRREIPSALSELRQVQRGRVRIGCNEIGALFLLPYFIEYRRTYPKVSVDLVRHFSREIPNEIANGNLDFGILSYKPNDPFLKTTPVYRDQVVLVVYPGHRLSRRRKVSIGELAGETFAAHNVASNFRRQVVAAFNRRHVPLQIGVELPTIDAIKTYVKLRKAVALIPRMCIHAEVKYRDLIEIEVTDLRIRRTLYATHRSNASLSFAADAFLETLREGFTKPDVRL